MNKLVLIILLSLGLSSIATSQKGYELGGWVGGSWYFGDLNTEFRLDKPSFAGGLRARLNFNTRTSVTASLNYGRIIADDADSNNSRQRDRNLSFFSDIYDFTVNMEFNFFNYVHGSSDEWYTPYILGGFSIFRYSPKTEIAPGEVHNLRDFGTEGQFSGGEYGNINAAFTFGLGFKWDISETWSLNLQLGSRQVFTDYIDDVSTTYPDLNLLEATRGPLARQLSDRSGIDGFATPGKQRGDSKTNDSYNFIGIGIMKYFGELPCPPISNF